MKVITKEYQVFKYDELSDEAEEKVFANWQRDNEGDYFWHEDNEKSLYAFAKHFDITIKDYRYGGYDGRDGVYFSFDDENIEEMAYVRLWKYLNNHNLVDGKFLDGDCPLTGYCVDDVLLNPIRDFIKKPYDITFRELIRDCFDNWVNTCNADIEYQMSKECFLDIYAYDHIYLKTGKVFYQD